MNHVDIEVPRQQEPRLEALLTPTGPSQRVPFPLGLKLALGAALISLLPLALIAGFNTFFATQRSRAALTEAAQKQLVAIRDTQHSQLSSYLETALRNSEFIATNPTLVTAIKDLVAGYNNLPLDSNNGQPLSRQDLAERRVAVAGFYNNVFQENFRAQNGGQSLDIQAIVDGLSDASVALQYAYIVQNPFPEAERAQLLDAKDGSSYSAAHAQHQQELQALAGALGFADIHLVEPETGRLVFTTEKQVDIGQSLANGPLAASPMGEAYARVAANNFSREAHIGNLTPFFPTYNGLNFFTAVPVYEGNTLLGVVTLEVPSETLDNVISNNQDWQTLGLGNQGETRIVDLGSGLRLTNDREFVENQTGFLEELSVDGFSQNALDSVTAKNSSAGFVSNDQTETDLFRSQEAGFITTNDGDLLAYRQLAVGDLSWTLVADQDTSEILAPVATLTQSLIRQALLITLGVLALVGLLTLFFIRSITRPVARLAAVAERVGQGDLSQLAPVQTQDEIGALATTFNNSILQLRDANERQEAEIQRGQQLQTNIGEFLNVAMDIAQGDFTKRGQVSEDALGNVVDAINFMTEELGFVLKGVQNATESVNQGATDMFGTADSIARSADIQAQEAQKARNEVDAVTASIRQMAQTAGSSAQAAERALVASQEGREAVTATLAEMQNIRREVQTVAKRVKGLSDRSLEISEIVETISKIAKQTNLLALNAALEASSAGDAGARFATVAGEVRALAENTTASVQRVASLVRSVQDEVQEVLVGVETGNRQVEGGYRVAQQAGERLEEIATIAEQTAQFAQQISTITREQVSRVEQVGQVVEGIADISEQSQETVSLGREAAERLQTLATELSNSIARFRIA